MEIQRYTVSATGVGSCLTDKDANGKWVRFTDHAAALAEMQGKVDAALKLAEASERWRLAYQEGKEKLYAMGGAIAEAALDNLPCNEGGLDRLSRQVFLYPQLATAQAEVARLKEALVNVRPWVATSVHDGRKAEYCSQCRAVKEIDAALAPAPEQAKEGSNG